MVCAHPEHVAKWSLLTLERVLQWNQHVDTALERERMIGRGEKERGRQRYKERNRMRESGRERVEVWERERTREWEREEGKRGEAGRPGCNVV